MAQDLPLPYRYAEVFDNDLSRSQRKHTSSGFLITYLFQCRAFNGFIVEAALLGCDGEHCVLGVSMEECFFRSGNSKEACQLVQCIYCRWNIWITSNVRTPVST
jgi:coenzyme F420-reducing hydrogenase delta subunit